MTDTRLKNFGFTCVPPVVDRVVKTFCGELRPQTRPVYVPVQTEPDARLLECYDNVQSLIRRSGGEIVYGWAIWTMPQVLIEAEHHAIWRTPSGTLVDPTPHDPPSETILFLSDPDAEFMGQSIDRRRKALSDHPLVEQLISRAEERTRISSSVLPGEEISLPVETYEALWVGDPEFGKAFSRLALTLRGANDPCVCGSGRKYGRCCKGLIGIR
jgi:uncharacterized protein YecA (UPF0149 family)